MSWAVGRPAVGGPCGGPSFLVGLGGLLRAAPSALTTPTGKALQPGAELGPPGGMPFVLFW